ncbi:TonB-dependent receptor plug domain-containing protein [Billgrantia endophytica]|uniref:TonB-dependent receptor n=1 Tax=Billgrantia endophytica TaxID=2033802 RepID=A0A2N7TYP8_9GAMM|nr:TonB-dependent receptor [Halomonas endophytica]PMR73296.1 TonB-dependent receptor [Halomonas endophytica]
MTSSNCPPGSPWFRHVALTGVLLSCPGIGLADDGVFQLGTIRILAPEQTTLDTGTSIIDSDTLRLHDRETLAEALELAPGVSRGYVGGRGEQMVHVRGFDRVQVPIYIDGIPAYVPYDGFVDLGRFTTHDLAQIEVAKGFSSLLYGPNALGGAINLVSKRPTETFEGEVGGGFGLDSRADVNRYRLYTNLGTRQDDWWLQVGASWLKTDHFRLPDGFTANNIQEDGGRRENSHSEDSKLNLRVGYTPNATDEYVFGHLRQQGEKGQPVYAGSQPFTNATRRWWEWPEWDKTSTFLATTTQLGSHKLLTRVYYDTYQNTLLDYGYEDGVRSDTLQPGYPSRYDDYTYGFSTQGDFDLGDDTRLQLAYHFKDDIHRSQDDDSPRSRYQDRTHYLAAEGTQQLSDDLTLIAGLAWASREAREATNVVNGVPMEEEKGSNTAVNGQLGVTWQSGEGLWRASYARKSRFANIRDRYSYRFGRAIPNPDLATEYADHYEVGYDTPLASNWQLSSALFYSEISDSIQSVTVSPSACTNPSPDCTQMQNIGESRMQGVELGVQGHLGNWELNGIYTWLDRKNTSDPDIKPTGTPSHKLFAAATWNHDAWRVTGHVDAASDRYSSSDGLEVDGFAVYGIKASYTFDNALRLEGGIHNLTDELYEYTEGYPEPGRHFSVGFHLPL